jgi:hypothetical protein
MLTISLETKNIAELGMIFVSKEMSWCCFLGAGSEGLSLESISQVHFWNSLLKSALEIGEKHWKRVLEEEGSGNIRFGNCDKGGIVRSIVSVRIGFVAVEKTLNFTIIIAGIDLRV